MSKWLRPEIRMGIKFEPRDLWIGIYWDTSNEADHFQHLKIYICIVPLFPIWISIYRHVKVEVYP